MNESVLPTHALWSYAVAAAAYLAFLVHLHLVGRDSAQRGRALVVAVLLSAAWAGCAAAFAHTFQPAWLLLANVLDAARYGAWFFLLGRLIATLRVGPDAAAARRPLRALVALAAAVVAWQLLAGFVLGGASAGRIGGYLALGMAVLGLVLVEQLYRNAPVESRWGVKPLCIGLAALFLFDVFIFAELTLFNAIDADLWSARGLVSTLLIPFLVLSAARNPQWRFDIAVSRRVVFHSTTLLLAGGYLLLVSLAGYYVRFFGGSWGGALQAAFAVAAGLGLAVFLFSGTVRSRVRVFVSKHFFSYRYDYREEWLRFTRALSDADEHRGVGERSVQALADLVESPGGVLWLREDQGDYGVAARWNVSELSVREPGAGALVSFLERRGWVVDIDECRRSPSRYDDLELPEWLATLPGAWLLIPLPTESALVGFVLLTRARAPVVLDWEVNDLLKTAARQAASFIAQMRSTEALLEARKFDAFNRMSAFVVHDIKNLVAQLALLTRNAEKHIGNPEFQRDMLETVRHVTERMRHLLLQLREGATPVEAPRPVDLVALARAVVGAKQAQKPALSLDAGTAVQALGHADRLERVLGHLVQNALDATNNDERVWVRVSRRDVEAVIEVGDNDRGMTPEFVREQLFRPFRSTKQGGMGIGAFESQQYVRELGGNIEVETAPGEGTRFLVRLPAVSNRHSIVTEIA